MIKKNILVAGSIAYDYIDSKVFFGGCAANIAYNLHLLNTPAVLCGIVGSDFSKYEKWLKKNKISTSHLIKINNKLTARAQVKNIPHGHGIQVVKFDSGAADLKTSNLHKISNTVSKLKNRVSLAIISPNPPDVMNAYCEACTAHRIPYLFDPGPVASAFTKSELRILIKKSIGLFANEEEYAAIKQKTEWSEKQIRTYGSLIIKTLGEKGSQGYLNGSVYKIPPVRSKKPIDPTGCGDAYRAGVLSILVNYLPNKISELEFKKAGLIGSSLATLCLETLGTQNHTL